MSLLTSSKIDKKNAHYKEFEIYQNNSSAVVCGIDEVGRGCSWGPMVLGVVVLKPFATGFLIKDSKKISAQIRLQAIEQEIIPQALALGTIVISSFELERLGLTLATKKAIISALELCQVQLARSGKTLTHALIDQIACGKEIVRFCAQNNVAAMIEPKFEEKSISVAAASILAKVYRDQFVNRAAALFPLYELEKHKGYSTLAHFKSLTRHGSSLLHREKFVNTLLNKRNKYHEPDNS